VGKKDSRLSKQLGFRGDLMRSKLWGDQMDNSQLCHTQHTELLKARLQNLCFYSEPQLARLLHWLSIFHVFQGRQGQLARYFMSKMLFLSSNNEKVK